MLKILGKGKAAFVTVTVSGPECGEVGKSFREILRYMNRTRRNAGEKPFDYVLEIKREAAAAATAAAEREELRSGIDLP